LSAQVDDDLFPAGLPSGPDAALPLEQYKLMLGTIESLESRRQTLHTFFMSINSLFLAAIGLLGKESLDSAAVATGVLVLAVAGAVLSWSWRGQLTSYEQVASSKWTVINSFESCMPSRPFCAEYQELQRRRYRSFTRNEAAIPQAFVVLYGVAFVMGVLLLAGVG
jgi:protein-S-isoprenylcysteine O-methyltransferase Ste14